MGTFRTLRDELSPLPFSNRAEWEKQAAWLRRQIGVSLGQLPFREAKPFQTEVFGKWKGPDYTCEKVALQSLPGVYLTGNLFRPLKPSGLTPIVLSPHGHWPDGRLHDHDVRGSVPERCIHLARMGHSVFSYDKTGYNDSCQLDHRQTPEDALWGFGMLALQTLNSRVALEFMLGLPGIDPERVGITGASGGGTQSFILMALDERLTAGAPINMISLEMQGGCICENAPLLRLHATNVDIVGLFAPNPVFMGSCTGDWTHKTLERERLAVETIYDLYGAKSKVDGLHVDAPHNYNAEMCDGVYAFFNRVFSKSITEPLRVNPLLPKPPLRDRMVWWGREAPAPLSAEQIHAIWQSKQEAVLAPILKAPARMQSELIPLLPHCLGLNAHGQSLPARTKIQAVQTGDTLTVSGPPTDHAIPKDVHHPTCYNNPPLLDQVHAIHKALQESGCRTLAGQNGAGAACLLAATQSPDLRTVQVEMEGFDPSDNQSWQTHFTAPFIRQIGGVETVKATLHSQQIEAQGLPE